MAPHVTIRPAALADEDALGELDRRAWSTLHAVTAPPQPPYGPFFDSTHRPEDILVAVPETGSADGTAVSSADGGGDVVGYIRVVPPTALPSHAHVRQIQGLVVDERARGRGVARALLDAACARAREQGARRLTLRVLGHNTPARSLYAAAGFREEGRLPGEFLLDGEYVDDILMGIGLTP